MQSTRARRHRPASLRLPSRYSRFAAALRLAMTLCLALWMLPAMAAQDRVRWQAELARLHRDPLPETVIRQRLQKIEAQLPADPPYAIRKELAQVRIRLTDDHDSSRAQQQALRRLALQNGDRDTARLMQINEIFDSHSGANMERSLRTLDRVRLDMREASPEVRDAMAMAYAYMYWDVGNFELALRHLLQARELARSQPRADPGRVAERGEAIARLYVDMHDAARALEMLAQVGRDMPATATPILRTHMVATRGAAYTLAGQPRDAVELLGPALARAPAGDPSNATQRLRQELARAYFALGEPANARTLATQMIAASAQGSPYFKAEGEVLQGAADAALGRVDTGLATLQRGLRYFERAAQVVALQAGLGRKVDALAAAGRSEQALAASRKQHALLLRLYDSNRAQGVASLQVEEDIARREREIRDLSSTNALQEAMLGKERIRNLALRVVTLLAAGMVILLGLLLHATRQQRKALWKDALTGAYNRHYLSQWVRGRKTRTAMRRAVALLDLDHFKAINDRLGHAAGDEVLRQAGPRLRGVIDKHGEIFRWGGEEFLVVQDLAADADMQAWLRSLLQALARPVTHAGESLPLSASIGGLLIPAEIDAGLATLKLATRVADAGMYQAKADGRGRATWLRMREAGRAAWPWTFTISPRTLQDWQAQGWVEARTVLPQDLD